MNSLLATMLVVSLQMGSASPPPFGRITRGGEELAHALDAIGVDRLWLPGGEVNWETGEAVGRLGVSPRTHCSAFVAAFAERGDVYILRPPQHAEELLANAQSDWLQGDGEWQGWRPVPGAVAAQWLANAGNLVVAVYKRQDPTRPGHIAVVRPSPKSIEAILHDGPQITQAGEENYVDTTLRNGFRHHPDAWARHHRIRFFAHPVAWTAATP